MELTSFAAHAAFLFSVSLKTVPIFIAAGWSASDCGGLPPRLGICSGQ